jgi:Protein of unknown function (DUF2924)
MTTTIRDKLAALPLMRVNELRRMYAELFGEATRANNRDWLAKRIGWRLQAQSEGGLSERAKQRARELANENDLRLIPPANIPATTVIAENRDTRLPMPGTIIERDYKGNHYEVEVRADGFVWNNQPFKTLTAVAKSICGQHVNGFHFFGLTKEEVS